jgi:hypothetical protein
MMATMQKIRDWLARWLGAAQMALAQEEPQAWPSLNNYPYGPAPR